MTRPDDWLTKFANLRVDRVAAAWQEDYFEHIIRDEDELFRIREYILSNPVRWKLDRENPEAEPGPEEEWPWNPNDDS